MSMRFLFAGYDAAIFAVMCGCVIAVRGSVLSRGVRWLIAGLASALVGLTLAAIWSPVFGFFSIVVAAVCIFGCFALMHQAIVDILDSSLHFYWVGLGLAFAVGFMFYRYGYHSHSGDPKMCIYAISTAVAIQAAISLMLLLAHEEEALRYQLRVVSALLIVVILLQGIQVIATAIWSPKWSLTSVTGLQACFTLVNCILALAIAGAILWLGWSVHQRNLEATANTDSLTGLLNRRAFDRILNDELSSIRLEPSTICLVLIDLDSFKQINDTHGRLVGDEVIRQVGRLLKACTRSTDHVARYGGEGFAMLLCQINCPRAEAAAERLRCAISSIQGLPEKIHVTASFGIAMNRAGENLHSFFARSDEALHLSKQAGRNMVRVHTGNLKPSLVYTESS